VAGVGLALLGCLIGWLVDANQTAIEKLWRIRV